MKKHMIVALVLVLLIPVVLMLGGALFSLINPEIAAGHANYARNFRILSFVKNMSMLAAGAIVAILWVVACSLVIRSKGRSLWWLFLAALGPIGFAILATLNDRASDVFDRYALFVAKLGRLMRVAYEACSLVIIWLLAYEGMVFLRNLMILRESAVTGMPTAQIIATQNASSGMWAFGEGMEVMYMVVLLCVLRPFLFNLVGRVAATMAASKAP